MQPKTAFLVILVLLSGCQWLAKADERRNVEAARDDDRACRAAGTRWPGEAYVDCRRFRADDRQRELWQEMQLSRQQPADVGIQPGATATYRPIRAENYACTKSTSVEGETYIECGESN